MKRVNSLVGLGVMKLIGGMSGEEVAVVLLKRGTYLHFNFARRKRTHREYKYGAGTGAANGGQGKLQPPRTTE